MTRATPPRTVLVFSVDPLAAALLGGAIELAGCTPVFPGDGESPRDVLLRTRPRVAFVDCDHEQACTESFFGPALMARTRVIIFSSSRSRRSLAPVAAEFGVRTVTLPVSFEELAELLREPRSTLAT